MDSSQLFNQALFINLCQRYFLLMWIAILSKLTMNFNRVLNQRLSPHMTYKDTMPEKDLRDAP